MGENNRQTIFGVIIILVILAVVGLLLFFSCGEDAPPPPKEMVKTESEKLEKKEELPEFIEKKEFYPTGEVKGVYYVYRVKPEIRHKQYVGYYKSGEKKMEYTYKDNVKEGPLNFWYQDKKMALEGAFACDKRDGEFKEFHPNGNLKLTYKYGNGLLQGAWIEYYDDGKTKMIEKSFKDGKLDGTYYQYTIKSEVKEQTYFKNGKVSRPIATPDDAKTEAKK